VLHAVSPKHVLLRNTVKDSIKFRMIYVRSAGYFIEFPSPIRVNNLVYALTMDFSSVITSS